MDERHKSNCAQKKHKLISYVYVCFSEYKTHREFIVANSIFAFMSDYQIHCTSDTCLSFGMLKLFKTYHFQNGYGWQVLQFLLQTRTDDFFLLFNLNSVMIQLVITMQKKAADNWITAFQCKSTICRYHGIVSNPWSSDHVQRKFLLHFLWLW